MAENRTDSTLRNCREPNGQRKNGNSDPNAEAIQAWLVSRLSELLEIEAHTINVGEPFVSYGLGSTELVGLSGELSEWLGRQLPAELAYECPTIEALARRLADSSSPSQPFTEVNRKANAEAIAVIGIGCRFPGANNPRAFWTLVRNGVDAIREVPGERFSLDDFFDPDPAVPGKIVTRWGGFIEQPEQFDASFFGISPREAARMDPQQRLLLEVTWEALEDAGQARERLAGTPTGVFIGISNNDFGRLQFNDSDRIDAYAGTGNALSIAANRISYVFDFRGPSIAIDTACSSSLVAVHQACSSLRSGESTLALAGGVNLILSPAITINFSKAGVMAPDGRCKAFDARADGYVRSEGAGVVVLKPLAKALADGDPIYAVIRGSAVNQDGRSNGLTAPNPLAQEAVLREAYRQADVSPGDVQYVETHGTGTRLGDPIEAKALGAVLALNRSSERACRLGSVKTNIGHLEAAAGIAGFIKVALALQHREIPPSLHFEQPNPHIPFDRLPLRVQTTLEPWPMQSSPALAGVSSFGFGGTNAHVVLQEASRSYSETRNTECGTEHLQSEFRDSNLPYLLPISARSPQALRSLARDYQDLLTRPESAQSLHDICYSASLRRSHHEYRLALTGNSAAQMAEQLASFLRGDVHPGLCSGHELSHRRRKLVFVFSGQGSQWFGMARMLVQREAVFRDAVECCDYAMRPHGDWSLLKELIVTDPACSRLNEVEVLQPALFAIQVALTALWRSRGIEPHAVVGHSMGEVAAAHVAGALSLEDAVLVICSRSRIVKPTIGYGAMAAVELSIAAARHALLGSEDRVSIAASNSPMSTVLSGDPAALEAIVGQLQHQGIFCRMIKVDFAAHSPQMEPLAADLQRALEGLEPRPASLPIYSTVTGQFVNGLSFDPLYWTRNLREPVLFATAVQRLLEDEYDIFMEVSPHPILLSSIQQAFHHTGKQGVVLPSLRRQEEEDKVLATSLGALYTLGYPIDWSHTYPQGGHSVLLPSYPWQREPCWLNQPAQAIGDRPRHDSGAVPAKHSLLGRHFQSARAETHFWEGVLDKTALPYLDDHRVEGVALLPAALYVEMMVAAAAEMFPSESLVLKDIEFRRALFLPDGKARAIQVILSRDANGAASVHIYSRPSDIEQSGSSWTLHATAKICLQPQHSFSPVIEESTFTEVRTRCSNQISSSDYYLGLRESGIDYGPSFQSINQLWQCNDEILGQVRIPDGPFGDFRAAQFHPAIMDALFQTLGAGVAVQAPEHGKRNTYMPTHVDEIRIYGQPGLHLWSHANLQERDSDAIKGEVRLLDDAGHVAIEILGLRLNNIGDPKRAARQNLDDLLYEFQWQVAEHSNGRPAEESSAPGSRGKWLIFADCGGVGEALGALIRAQEGRRILVTRGKSYERSDDDHFCIRHDQPEDMRQLFEVVSTSDKAIWRGIVHLWSLDACPAEETTVASLLTTQTLGCSSALQLVQEVARVEPHHLPRLWLVTRNAQPAGREPVPLAIAQTPLWGLGRVIAEEHPLLWGGLIDLESNISPREDAAQLWKEISSPDGEDQIAFRQGRRHSGRLLRRRQTVPLETPLSWRTDGSYLITGGLGDLGLSVARWMVEQGARRLILLGRTQLPPRAQWNSAQAGSRLAHQIAVIRELEALGTCVHLVSLDVADDEQLSAFLGNFQTEGWPPIRGVVHAAGVLHDGLLLQLDAATLDLVLRPKMIGGWLLHRLLEDAPLDFFVLFSSAASLLGQPGQGNYAAANAFLDALAHDRRAHGRPALSINWGAWKGLGFAGTPGAKRLASRLALLGIDSLEPRQALEVLERLLSQCATQVAAVPVDWSRYRQFYPAATESRLLSELASEQADDSPPARNSGETRTTLLAARPTERHQLLQCYLADLVARVLGLPASKLDVQQPLSNLGLDSLMAVELKNRIAVDLGVNVPMVTFLSGPSVEQAVLQLLHLVTCEPEVVPVPLASRTAQDQEEQLHAGIDEDQSDSLDQLSDEEVSSLLTDLLDKEEVSG